MGVQHQFFRTGLATGPVADDIAQMVRLHPVYIGLQQLGCNGRYAEFISRDAVGSSQPGDGLHQFHKKHLFLLKSIYEIFISTALGHEVGEGIKGSTHRRQRDDIPRFGPF